MQEAVSLHNLILTVVSIICSMIFSVMQWNGVMQNCLVGVAPEESRWHAKLYAKKSMEAKPLMHAYIQISKVEVSFTTKVQAKKGL